MDTWIWGPLVLQKNIVFAVVAALAGYGILRIRSEQAALGSAFRSVIVNAVLLWVISWKLSLLLFGGLGVLRNPMLLLYFSGGVRGAWIAALVAALYILFSARKLKMNVPDYIDSVLVSIFGGYTVYLALLTIIGEDHRLTHGVTAIVQAVMIVLWLRTKPSAQFRPPAQWAVMLLISYALVQSLAVNLWDKPGAAIQAGDATGLKVGQQAPDFELTLLSGQQVKLSDYRGKTVILNFWATWCPPCRAEMPEMQQFYDAHQAEGTVILGVNATSTEVSVPVVKAWIEEWAITFPIPLDKQGDVSKQYRVNAYPATYVIDAEGIIRDKHPGPMNAEMLKNAAGKAKPGK
ncbi:peroxiredoxin family protein [Paenibacillus allorhizosphaerae]|nr:redoxin domain-containing protein [Paenibacillus allorhizosphaerae]